MYTNYIYIYIYIYEEGARAKKLEVTLLFVGI